jgi:SAM-dependent methyltransferase
MEHRDAVALIAGAIPRSPGTWADLGAGDGTFTLALADLLSPGAQVHAVDRDGAALAALRRAPHDVNGVTIHCTRADFLQPLVLPPLDGVLLANALHYVEPDEQGALLARLRDGLRAGGRIVIVDYEGRRPNHWVPHVISRSRLRALALKLGMATPVEVGSYPSAFGGEMYAAWIAPRP